MVACVCVENVRIPPHKAGGEAFVYEDVEKRSRLPPRGGERMHVYVRICESVHVARHEGERGDVRNCRNYYGQTNHS